MHWTSKYWDLINQIYWTPDYIGLKSIPRSEWTIDGDSVSIPKSLTHPTGPLYRRLRSGSDYQEYVQSREETFNHIFDLAFAIMPGDVVAEIFDPFTHTSMGNNYESFGRELFDRYLWGEHANITAPDAYFVSETSVLAIELKFDAKTSLDQLAKYLMLLMSEELIMGEKQGLDLLYIFNSAPDSTFQSHIGVGPDEIEESLYDALLDSVNSSRVRHFLATHEDQLRKTLNRINVKCTNWQALHERLTEYAAQLSDGRGGRTLKSLISGVCAEIEAHPLSKVSITA